MSKKKILIASGGGGHFSPALAVIKSLPSNYEVLVAGRKYALEGDKALSLEYQTTKSLNIAFVSITSGRLQRKFTKRTLPSLFKLPIGMAQALWVILKFRPNILLSFGGYLSLPIVVAAKIFGIPIVIHEQTLGAGLANKMASKLAKRVCISWESSAQFFPKSKVVLTGNPVRMGNGTGEIGDRKWALGKGNGNVPLILITGGSSGSHFINKLIEQTLENLVKEYRIIHQTGDSQEFRDYDRLTKLRSSSPNIESRYTITKFIEPDEFGHILSQADLVICRSGMNTVSEIVAFGKPALLIPLPYSQGNEQLHNAQFVRDLGLGEVLPQQDLTSEQFYKKIKNTMENIGSYKKAGVKAKKLVVRNATQNIIDVVKEYV